MEFHRSETEPQLHVWTMDESQQCSGQKQGTEECIHDNSISMKVKNRLLSTW